MESKPRVYLAVSLEDDLFRSAIVVSEGIRGVAVLIEDVRVGDLLCRTVK